jgi:PDZ domain/Aspartyl protease
VLGDQVAHSPAETFRQSFSMRCRDDLRRGVIGKVVCWEEHGGRPDIDAYSGGRFSVQRKRGTCTTLLRRQNSCHFRSGDGVPGSFEIDTGSSTALVLQRGFVEQHGLEARHPDGLRMKVGGIGGVFDTVATRLDRFDLAASKIERPVVEFPSRDEGGIPVAGIDGSIGYQILRQFVITFDYSHREIWFERSAAFGESTIEWKTGFQAVKAGDNGFRVVTVQPDTPAANAGIRVGDLITVIDGRPAASVGQAEFGGLTRRADGTIVRLEINRDGTRHSIAVTLKELLP